MKYKEIDLNREEAMSTIDKLQTFITGVLIGQGMTYEDAVEVVKAIVED